jgi:E3 ubiquitin-protein ligase FANCL
MVDYFQSIMQNTDNYGSIEVSETLKSMLHGYEDLVKQRLSQSKTLSQFLIEFQDILSRACKGDQSKNSAPQILFYPKLIEEINRIGWNKLTMVDNTMTSLGFLSKDSSNRRHLLTIKLGKDYPMAVPTCSCELPEPFDPFWNSGTSTLSDIIRQFESSLNEFQLYFSVIEDIDLQCWVIEPEIKYQNNSGAPKKHQNSEHSQSQSSTLHHFFGVVNRRIALGNRMSFHFTIDPRHPLNIPISCQFLGPETCVNPVKERFHKNLSQKWETKMGSKMDPSLLRRNLIQCLEIDNLPSPQSKVVDVSNIQMECSICYSFNLQTTENGENVSLIPDKICDNVKCAKAFHRLCLYEWLRSIPVTKQSFDTLFGQCPYCSSLINVKIR